VFNAELGEGLATSWETGRDEDELDLFCHHLLVEEKATGKIVGTYRLQTLEMAEERGFYSATEYDLSRVPVEMLGQSLEVGRACIAREHRKRQVLYLLWKGLARYMAFNRKRYLFGCCSLTSQDAALGLRALDHLWQRGAIHPDLWVPALPGYECLADGAVETGEMELPQLFETYLRFGGKACSEPALDRRFGTIDFLVLLDTHAMDPRSHRMFFG
jgi:putative hemolysin